MKVILKNLIILCAVILFAIPLNAEQSQAIIPAEITGVESGIVEVNSEDAKANKALKSSQFTINKTGEITVDYNEPVDYKYTVKQIIPDEKSDMIYDTTIYDVEVFVEATDDTLVPHVVVWKDGRSEKCDKVTFTNKKKEQPKTSTDTSDTAEAGMYLSMLGISIVVMIGMILWKRRQSENS
jgi:ABC-type Na+ efflux pump permease subunit